MGQTPFLPAVSCSQVILRGLLVPVKIHGVTVTPNPSIMGVICYTQQSSTCATRTNQNHVGVHLYIYMDISIRGRFQQVPRIAPSLDLGNMPSPQSFKHMLYYLSAIQLVLYNMELNTMLMVQLHKHFSGSKAGSRSFSTAQSSFGFSISSLCQCDSLRCCALGETAEVRE